MRETASAGASCPPVHEFRPFNSTVAGTFHGPGPPAGNGQRETLRQSFTFRVSRRDRHGMIPTVAPHAHGGDVLDLVMSGGWLMLPIVLCSIAAVAIIAERLWVLQRERIAPQGLAAMVREWAGNRELTEERMQAVRGGSPLGRILASGLAGRDLDREVMKESIEDTGRQVVHELERYLNMLGTIAAVTPLLGLLGTVIGMIEVFGVITARGVGDPGVLAGGISEALITTAAGLTVAIPSLLFYRYFRGRVDALVLTMEQEALKMVEALHGPQADRRDRYHER